MTPVITHFTDDDLYKFTMCCAVIDNFPRAQVRYAFTDRDDRRYPPGFAAELERQIACLEELVITEEEIDFLQRRCNYIPCWFFPYLKGFRFRREWAHATQDADGHLHVIFEGPWSGTILLEVKVLAIISELYYRLTGQAHKIELAPFYTRSYAKGKRLIEAGCVFSDFGTRRRASFAAHETLVRALKAAEEEKPAGASGRFVGTSNVYLAMKYDLMPTGTMAHEFISAIGGMYGPQMANHLAMNAWRKTYRGALGTFLYDCFGWRIFSLNFSEDFANMFKGLRVDSGDNARELERIEAKYRALGVDPATKQIIFSNGLTTDEAIAIQKMAASRCQPAFGIGTHFTNDFPDLAPMNIVIKLTAAKITESWTFYNQTCKLSETPGKETGDPAVIRRFKEALDLT